MKLKTGDDDMKILFSLLSFILLFSGITMWLCADAGAEKKSGN